MPVNEINRLNSSNSKKCIVCYVFVKARVMQSLDQHKDKVESYAMKKTY